MVDDVDAHDLAGVHHPRRSASRSSGLGLGSPDGWLWNSTIAAAAAAAASRKTSRGWTTVVSSDPTDTSLIRSTRCFVSSITMPNCSTARDPYCGQQIRGQLPRRQQSRTLGHVADERAASELDRREHLRRARAADARRRAHSALTLRRVNP